MADYPPWLVCDANDPERLGRLFKKGVMAPIVPLSPSAGDAQFPLDVSHRRVRQARLAEFFEVIGDDLLP
jgi:hypothetical protein